MGKKPVKFSFDPSNLPPLTAMQHDELAALAKMQDDRIDTSDIAPLGDAFWKGALSNPFYKPTKKVTTVRIDGRCPELSCRFESVIAVIMLPS